jgi:hypothetical protein
MITKLEGYLAIPQFLLYGWAQRLLGKRYAFTPGQNSFHSLEKRTAREHAFVLLFPLVTLGTAGVVLLLAWAMSFVGLGYAPDLWAYLQYAPLWHQALWWLGLACLLYASFSIYKLPQVFQLLRQELRHQPPQDRNEYHRDGQSH